MLVRVKSVRITRNSDLDPLFVLFCKVLFFFVLLWIFSLEDATGNYVETDARVLVKYVKDDVTSKLVNLLLDVPKDERLKHHVGAVFRYSRSKIDLRFLI